MADEKDNQNTEPENEIDQNPETENIENNENEGSQEITLRPEIGVNAFRELTSEMETCYLDYAMSVIVSRALPDVRDGLKPVHRRILYTMNELGLRPSAKYRKSAAVVGDVLGKYHPHGDSAVYDAMVRLAQDFSVRYTLVDGQGNFGSIDGDSAAAMRYTEAKMDKLSEEMLADLDKETVDFRPNYDETKKEPVVLPSKVPQLLLNGSLGIAVGMATSIPPHNLGEVVDGLIHLIENPDANVEDLLKFIKGPDFPMGGILYDGGNIKEAYSTGRGRVTVRAKAEIEEMKNGKQRIVVTEIPYQVNKANLIMKIAQLVRDKKIQGITDIRDESNQDGIRMVIELSKTAYASKILNQLYKLTQLQENFNYNMIALVDGIQPRLLNLKNILEKFVDHRVEVVTRRTEYDLKVAQARAHILEGLRIALDQIDAVIDTIRKSPTKEEAKENLMKKFKLSELQAQAILEMRLQALAGLERQKIEDEYKEKLAFIAECEAILGDKEKLMGIIKDELIETKEKYADARRTKILKQGVGEFSAKDTIPNEPVVIMLTKQNYIKRLPQASFRVQGRGGKGVIGTTTKEEDEVEILRYATNHDDLLFFTSEGRVFKLPTYEIPQTSRQAKGTPVINILQLRPKERVTAMMNVGAGFEGQYLFFCTRYGRAKKTPVQDFDNIRKTGLIAIKLNEGDSLEWVRETSAEQQVMIITSDGKSVRFNEKDVRAMGRSAAGVRGIRLKDDDYVVEMDVITDPKSAELLVVMENGLGKKTKVEEYRLQGRGGGGVKTANVNKRTGKVVGAKILEDQKGDLILVASDGQTLRTGLENIPSRGRATQGVFLMRLKEGNPVASIAFVEEMPEKDEETEKEEAKKDDKKGAKKKDEKPKKEKAKVGTTVKLDDKEYSDTGLDALKKVAKEDAKDRKKGK